MAGQEPDLGVEGVGFVLQESEAVDRRAMDGGEVGVVGLVAGVGGLAELLGGEGWTIRTSNPASGRRPGPGGGTARCVPRRRSRRRAGALGGVADRLDGRLEAPAIVVEDGGWDEDFPVEIGQEELGSGLGGIDADDPKAFWAHGLHPGMEGPGGLVNLVRATSTLGWVRVAMRTTSTKGPGTIPISYYGSLDELRELRNYSLCLLHTRGHDWARVRGGRMEDASPAIPRRRRSAKEPPPERGSVPGVGLGREAGRPTDRPFPIPLDHHYKCRMSTEVG